MRRTRQQRDGCHCLADPGHAWKFGVSVRIGGEKDTVLETGKDSALAMYDRTIAMRVAERAAALAGYPAPTTHALRALRARYGVDVAIVEAAPAPVSLPELYRNAQF